MLLLIFALFLFLFDWVNQQRPSTSSFVLLDNSPVHKLFRCININFDVEYLGLHISGINNFHVVCLVTLRDFFFAQLKGRFILATFVLVTNLHAKTRYL